MEIGDGFGAYRRLVNQFAGNGISAVHFDSRSAGFQWQRKKLVEDHGLDHALYTFIDGCEYLFNGW